MQRIPQNQPTVEEVLTSGDARRAFNRERESESMKRSGGNVALSNVVLVILVILAAVVSVLGVNFTWTNFVRNIGSITVLSIFLYIITSMVYRNRYGRGKLRGRLDPDYRYALQGYRDKRSAIDKHGILGLVPQFCRDYKVKELREYRSDLLVDVDLTYEEYEQYYQRLSDKEVMKLRLPLETRKVIVRCNHAKPLHLTPGMILNENGEAERQKLLGQSGREREHKDKHKQMINRALTILFSGCIGFDLLADFSLTNIINWLVRMFPIAMAIISGDDNGYCNITVTEANFKRGQSMVIGMLFEWAGVKDEPACEGSGDEENGVEEGKTA